MKTRLRIVTAYDTSVSHYVGKDICLPSSLANEKGISPGAHNAGIAYETDEAIKIRYKAEEIWLPKCAVKVVTVGKKGLFDFEDVEK